MNPLSGPAWSGKPFFGFPLPIKPSAITVNKLAFELLLSYYRRNHGATGIIMSLPEPYQRLCFSSIAYTVMPGSELREYVGTRSRTLLVWYHSVDI